VDGGQQRRHLRHRPWKIFGEGPGTKSAAVPGQRFNENNRKKLTAEDVRFTTKGNGLYAFVMGWPGQGGFDPSARLRRQEQRTRIRISNCWATKEGSSGLRTLELSKSCCRKRNRPITR